MKFQLRSLNNSPWAGHMVTLTGVKTPPKARQAHQEWSREPLDGVDEHGIPKTNYNQTVKPTVDARWKANIRDGIVPPKKKPSASFRGMVTIEKFKELPADEQAKWATLAKERAAERKGEYLEALKREPSKEPAEIQT